MSAKNVGWPSGFRSKHPEPFYRFYQNYVVFESRKNKNKFLSIVLPLTRPVCPSVYQSVLVYVSPFILLSVSPYVLSVCSSVYQSVYSSDCPCEVSPFILLSCLSLHMSCLPTSLFINLSVLGYVSPFILLSVYLSVCPVCLPFCLPVCLVISLSLCVSPFILLSISVSFCMSVRLSIC
jgi:hypothetical protein